MLKNVALWLNGKPLDDITEQDLKKVYDRLEKGKIISKKTGKPIKPHDYYTKVFKSDFFSYIGKIDLARKIIRREKEVSEDVMFFELDDLHRMAQFTAKPRNQLILYALFDTGARIESLLNIRKRDCALRHNSTTGQDYYTITLRKEFLKSKGRGKHTRNHTVSTFLNETMERLKIVLPTLKDDDPLFPMTYSAVRKLVSAVSERANVKTKPDDKPPTIHVFRKSCACYLLRRGWSIDRVKARLHHTPSSDVIDKYISYFGLDEEEGIQEIQEGNIKDIDKQHKATLEKMNAVELHNRELRDEMDKMNKRLDKIDIWAQTVLDNAPKKFINELTRYGKRKV